MDAIEDSRRRHQAKQQLDASGSSCDSKCMVNIEETASKSKREADQTASSLKRAKTESYQLAAIDLTGEWTAELDGSQFDESQV